jgi:hypothetical protein
MSRSLIAMALLLSPLAAQASMPGFCGTFDLTRTSNEDLETIVRSVDLSRGQVSLRRGQCGLPGERVRICSACSDVTTETQMRVIRPMVGAPSHLAWHADWHLLRAGLKTSRDFDSRYAVGGPLAGENFFYMHRLMIKMVQMELAAAGQPCFAPWADIPSSIDDAKWPTPKKFATPDARTTAIAKLESMRAQLARFRNPKLLANISLNRLGEMIEPRLHMDLHAFYQSTPACSPEGRRQGFCDDLVPVQTSPLNKHFWKLHGLIDDLIGDWLRAHDLREIAVSCDGRPACYEWQATWVGSYPR